MSIILVIALVIILLLLAWALFGTGGGVADSARNKPLPENDEPEKILRRRASDRAIEKEFPEEPELPFSRRESVAEQHEQSGSINLPFSANEIISDSSRFRLYKRTLINSEVYARRGDIETAISLFRGVHDRILDSSVREKIDANIEYLNRFRQRRDDDIKKKIESSLTEPQHGGELRLKIDGPVPSTINIGLPEKAIDSDEIISKISGQIAKELGTIKDEVDRLKSKPEEKFDLDDYAEFAGLQHELKVLKEKFNEISGDREKALDELSRLRELKEREFARDEERGQNDLLNQIRNEMEKLNSLKNSLDNINNRFDEMASLRIPEAKREPAIIEARYEAPIPIHFDPKPVLEILEKLNQQRAEKPSPGKDEIPAQPETGETTGEDFTADELRQIEEPESPEDIPEFEEAEPAGDLTLDEIEGFGEEIAPEGAIEREDELFPEPEIFPEPEALPEYAMEETPEETAAELTEHEAEKLMEEVITPEEEETEPAITMEEVTEVPAEETGDENKPEEVAPPPAPVQEKEEEIEEKLPEPVETETEEIEEEPAVTEETLQKEIERYTEGEEDANAFDLLSEYGKPKDDSTLSDEDIFEKILKDDKKKKDDSQFEILGENQKEEQEYSFDDSRLDEKKKNDMDFYKKFIKPDRIKKRELPILRVSYDFKKLPDEFSLSREKNILEYSFYKYKPMLQKADNFIKHRQVRDAINYYKVVADQNIPVEFKAMIRKNIRDLTEYLEKYLSSE